MNLQKNETSLDPSLGQVQITFIAIQCVIGLSTIIGACFVLGLYLHERNATKISHRHIVSLATADLLQGVLTAPISIFLSFGVKINDKMCFEALSLQITAIFTTMFVLVSMSIDRYIAIVHPLYYKTRMTGTIANYMIISSWIFGICIGIIVYLYEVPAENPDALCFVYTERTNKLVILLSSTFFIIPCTLIFIYVYIKIYRVIIDSMGPTTPHKKKLRQLGDIAMRKNTSNMNERTIMGKITIREIRTTILLFLTVLLFLLSWIPGLILATLLSFFPNHVHLYGMLCVYTLSQINSVINPFIYARNIKNSGKIIKNWFRCFCCSN